jgi:hypothetical protein
VEAEGQVELAPAGEVLSIDDKFFIRITNRHPQKKRLYVSIFDLGLAQKITLLTHPWPSGYTLEAGETFVLGQDVYGQLNGNELGWSDQLPEDEVRPESFVIIATEQSCDLTMLETPGATAKSWQPTSRIGGNQLQQLVSQIQFGGTRDVRSTPGQEGYLVRHLSFELSPWRLPPRGKDFLIDDRPPGSLQVFAARAAAPRKLALRITELIVHDIRSWFDAADLRLDTLVTTRLPEGGEPPYRAETLRLPGIRDNERVPLDNALIYLGEARDFIDLRVWVSRDRERSQRLAELLEQQLGSAEFQEATGALLTSAGVSTSAPVVAALGAVAKLSAIAWKVLSAALPRSIGLYQTSLLAGEGVGFGQGRHPPRGVFRAQGFSFGYEVVAVD